ncbi:hypothetical protein I4U23_016725 [Adineta vaga]|nr:hypothetical protein I4U23_016725 [Adineta vaga]
MERLHFLLIILFIKTIFGQTTTSNFTSGKLIPFGNDQGDERMFRDDDAVSAPIYIPIRFPFFNQLYDEIKIEINGLILFGNRSYQGIDYKPQRFPVDNIICVAPFWADIITREDSISNIFYRQIIDPSTLGEIDRMIVNGFPGQIAHRSIWAFVVTWDRVPGYGLSVSFRNTFQAIVTTNGINSFAIYNYEQLQWSYGSASSNIHAQAGFNAGDMNNSFVIEKSFTSEVLSIVNDSNVAYPGRFIFAIGGDITNVACNTTNGLQVAPFRGSTYGGYEVRFYGICFDELNYIVKIDGQTISNCTVTFNSITCIMPIIFNGPSVSMEIFNLRNELVGQTKFLVDVVEDNSELLIESSTSTYDSLIEIDTNDTFTVRFKKDSVTKNYNFSIIITYYESIFTENYELIRIVPREQILYTSVNLSALDNLTIRYEDIFQHSTTRFDIDNIAITLFDLRIGILMKFAPPYLRLAYKLIKYSLKAVKKTRDLCEKWQEKLPQLPAPSTYELEVPRCPCRVPATGQNRFPLTFNNFQTDSSCSAHKINTCINNRGANHCYRRSFQPTGPGMKCCYDSNGLLLTNPEAGAGGLEVQTKSSGSIIQQIKHVLFDQLLAWVCCKLPSIITQVRPESCRKYHSQRPSFTCENVPLPVPSGGNGDPHFITFDDIEYTFNGYGEYVLFQGSASTSSQMIEVQIRTKSIESDSEDNKATAIVAFVIQNGNYSKIQFELFQRLKLLEIRVNNQPLDSDTFYNPSTIENLDEETYKVLMRLGRTIQFDDNHMSISQSNRTTFKITYSNAVQFIINIRDEYDFLNLVSILPKSYEKRCRGLLGNMDGDKTNEFIFQDDHTALNLTEQKSEERIFVFGQSWRVKPERTLFQYNPGQSYSTHQNIHYRPIFREELLQRYEDTPRYTLANANCQKIPSEKGREQCVYDILITNDQTMSDFHEDFQENVNEWQTYAELVHQDELNSAGDGLRFGSTMIYGMIIIAIIQFIL